MQMQRQRAAGEWLTDVWTVGRCVASGRTPTRLATAAGQGTCEALLANTKWRLGIAREA
jgi:hypothetical protein